MRDILGLFFLLLLFLSCNKYSTDTIKVLRKAKENRYELEKVLEHYDLKSSDSLKYKAALFLINNMDGHFSYEPIYNFDNAFDSIAKYPDDRKRTDIFEKILDSISEKSHLFQPKLVADIRSVNSEFLISNIELSFKAWNRVPKEKRASFEDFCNYVLPYKNLNEPIEPKSRQKLFRKYPWINDLFRDGATLKMVVDSVSSVIGHKNMVSLGKYYPIPLTVGQIEKSRLGLCDDGVNYLVHLFRAHGIICAREMIPQWGNHSYSGHSWVYFKYGSEEYSKQVHKNVDVKKEYLGESVPKVYRTTYFHNDLTPDSIFAKDVTKYYVPTLDLKIANDLNAMDGQPVLCVFNYKSQWEPISFGTKENKNNTYSDVGVNVLYLAANKLENYLVPINYPFFLNNDKQIHFFKPKDSLIDSVALTRKIGLTTPRHRRKKQWITNLNGGVFEGSNNKKFINPQILYEISNYTSTHLKTVKLNAPRKFKYIRFNSNGKESYLSRLAFFGVNQELLTGKIIKENNFEYKWKNGAFDINSLTYSGGKNFTLGLELKYPSIASTIDFQVRNDDNHINKNEEYELFYWKGYWNTLGKRVATDTVLYYDVPANSLLWLRNNSKGKEEHVFFIDKNKKQWWLGFDNY